MSNLNPRRRSRRVTVGKIAIGGDSPISVQSMTKCDTRDVGATLSQINSLAEAGCDIVRVAIPDMQAAQALGDIAEESPLPVAADIHFDYRLALEAIARGAKKIRLNPGNLRRPEEVKAVVEACAERKVPIRIGVNAGSISPDARKPYEDLDDPAEATARAMVNSAFGHIRLLEEAGFHDIVVSLKAFDVPATLRANRLLAEKSEYPIHLGITEAGRPPAGLVRSGVGLGILLAEGIGDTLRVSLTAHPVEEVRAGREILSALNLRRSGLIIVSCPTCGRCEVDLSDLVIQAEERLTSLDAELRKSGRTLQVAIMGCVVNGPGEAKEADVGIAAGKGKIALFSRGRPVRSLPVDEALDALVKEARRMAAGTS
ncbi:MAG: flavodoxin-dependent (E)-4-hydroxy-3-methylbut-2-enyl-diphosphate synthase [Armatimonadetes bacterium]|nr:flavodoxin-dependent (E)-4-hydroxy-3-methylbut-2-enyl-diphosphate synthase [Armatimonadota bacterium]NIM22986.1 flavodoxin-dependent (E)-4-hydroxy-3-methylbut-2-enyl-diphosphate synthase [Armatimonadota bacterium]NIM66857.1 flavodoxin-dependent (E)-4-hydroxy-3-methylbut-2-enyl-diphosphate synthase [Armatimonadota bacterium]NIM75397.1 flavodoxin-dependent (E)-4-hydroxy-3-methylbut-2-enyl-diphosphate synthase [Armatimonadota bacterium]NIN05044.1 flavodoxin-dependent (E)-4-hydroxy-3-methylbut-2